MKDPNRPYRSGFRKRLRFSAAVLWLVCCPWAALAGPPFTTDDPEPVKYRHWEFYVASQNAKSADGWSGTAPHLEVSRRHHLLFSAGRSIAGPTEFQGYIAYQFAFGPGLFDSKHRVL